MGVYDTTKNIANKSKPKKIEKEQEIPIVKNKILTTNNVSFVKKIELKNNDSSKKSV